MRMSYEWGKTKQNKMKLIERDWFSIFPNENNMCDNLVPIEWYFRYRFSFHWTRFIHLNTQNTKFSSLIIYLKTFLQNA